MGFGFGPEVGGYGHGGPVAGCGCDHGYSYGGPVGGTGYGAGNGFALIVVLFILLIIVGAAWF
nr:YjcZ family sporulation protein [Oceanobacillus rekensis]